MARKKSSRTTKKTTKKKPSGPRASWRGTVQLGLVTFEVNAINAHAPQEDRVTFHQLHKECHSRIRYQKVCPVHGPVEQDEIVSGYEYSKGKYVEIDADELEALSSREDRSLTIDAFISPDEIDPIHFDGRMYYLSPSTDAAREPYRIFLKAMEKKDRWGVGQVIWSGREQLVVLRPYEDALHMAMLNYEAEIRDPADTITPLPTTAPPARSVRLAEQLIDSWSDDKFNLAAYHNEYNEKVSGIIDDKVKGRETVEPEVEEEPEVINLMDALKKSMEHTVHRRRPATSTPRRRTTRARSSGHRSTAHRTASRAKSRSG